MGADDIVAQDEAEREIRKVKESVMGIKKDFQEIRSSMGRIRQGVEKKDEQAIDGEELKSIESSLGKMVQDFSVLKNGYFDEAVVNDDGVDVADALAPDDVVAWE